MILAGAAEVELNLGRTKGARVEGALRLSRRCLSMTRSFGAASVASAVFPEMAALPPNAARAESGAPSLLSPSSGLSDAATTGSSEDGAAAATTGSAAATVGSAVVDEAL